MEHEKFPVEGFEFMNEPATDEQKNIIVESAKRKGHFLEKNGVWPEPFTRWDAYQMIKALEELPDV
jgi:hypothetical protein